jgi:peptide deformylase
MAVLEILTYPHPKLRRKSVPIENIGGNVEKLLDDIAETMYHAPGIGLAAPQVGLNLRVCVIDVSPRDENSEGLIELINPVIISAEGVQMEEEGCLSIPGFVSQVKRKAIVKVRALNRSGKPFEIEGTGLLARAFQHEIDHLDGILFIDRLSRLKRELLKRKIEKVLGKEESYAAF